jgi:plasmid maintenance system antidote protein VapI
VTKFRIAHRVTQILNGTRSITGDTALRLAHFFGTSPQFWLNLQTLYDLRLAQQKTGRAIKSLPRLKRREPVPA